MGQNSNTGKQYSPVDKIIKDALVKSRGEVDSGPTWEEKRIETLEDRLLNGHKVSKKEMEEIRKELFFLHHPAKK
jgi:hypothetical protein